MDARLEEQRHRARIRRADAGVNELATAREMGVSLAAYRRWRDACEADEVSEGYFARRAAESKGRLS